MHQNDGLTTVAEGLYFRTNMGKIVWGEEESGVWKRKSLSLWYIMKNKN